MGNTGPVKVVKWAPTAGKWVVIGVSAGAVGALKGIKEFNPDLDWPNTWFSGGEEPVRKGQEGEELAEEALEELGYEWVGGRITIRVQTPEGPMDVQPDGIVVDSDGALTPVEVKTGPEARLTTRQRDVKYPVLEQYGGTLVGDNAGEYEGVRILPGRVVIYVEVD